MKLNHSTGDQLFCVNMSIVAITHDDVKAKKINGITKLQ